MGARAAQWLRAPGALGLIAFAALGSWGCRTSAIRLDARPAVPTASVVELKVGKATVPANLTALMVSVQPTPPAASRDKIHRLIRLKLQDTTVSDSVSYLITFRDPVFGNRASLDSVFASSPLGTLNQPPAKPGKAQAIAGLRAAHYQGLEDTLRTFFGAQVVNQFWLSHSLTVRMSEARVETLATWPSVVKIDPVWADEAPQGQTCSSLSIDVAEAGKQMGIKGWAGAGLGGGRYALLDSGIHSGHQFLSSSNGGWRSWTSLLSCDAYGCTAQNTQEDVLGGQHGTCTAMVLSAGGTALPHQRGLTGATYDSYQVYGIESGDTVVRVHGEWTARAFERLLDVNPPAIVVTEVAITGGANFLTDKASLAFDDGIAVLAANGNHPEYGVGAPANGSRVLGVGAYCPASLTFEKDHAKAWENERWKPEVAGPHEVMVQSATSPVPYPGTSGATPFVAAAALYLRNWMMSAGIVPRPGLLYAALILCGMTDGVTQEDPGRLVLPGDGMLWCGSRVVMTTETGAMKPESIKIDARGLSVSSLKAAIWWPEYGLASTGSPAADEIAWIALQVRDLDAGATGFAAEKGVFQRVVLTGSAEDWAVDLVPIRLPKGHREVYYAIWAKP